MGRIKEKRFILSGCLFIAGISVFLYLFLNLKSHCPWTGAGSCLGAMFILIPATAILGASCFVHAFFLSKDTRPKIVFIAFHIFVVLVWLIFLTGLPPEEAGKATEWTFRGIKFYDSHAVHYENACAYLEHKKYDRAIIEFSAAIKIKPDDIFSYNGRGRAYSGKGDYDLAVSDFSRAINAEPRYSFHYECRCSAYNKKGDYEQAIVDCSKAIELNPPFADAYLSRAEAYFSKKEYEKAWVDIHRAEELRYPPADPKFLKKLKEASGREK